MVERENFTAEEDINPRKTDAEKVAEAFEAIYQSTSEEILELFETPDGKHVIDHGDTLWISQKFIKDQIKTYSDSAVQTKAKAIIDKWRFRPIRESQLPSTDTTSNKYLPLEQALIVWNELSVWDRQYYFSKKEKEQESLKDELQQDYPWLPTQLIDRVLEPGKYGVQDVDGERYIELFDGLLRFYKNDKSLIPKKQDLVETLSTNSIPIISGDYARQLGIKNHNRRYLTLDGLIASAYVLASQNSLVSGEEIVDVREHRYPMRFLYEFGSYPNPAPVQIYSRENVEVADRTEKFEEEPEKYTGFEKYVAHRMPYVTENHPQLFDQLYQGFNDYLSENSLQIDYRDSYDGKNMMSNHIPWNRITESINDSYTLDQISTESVANIYDKLGIDRHFEEDQRSGDFYMMSWVIDSLIESIDRTMDDHALLVDILTGESDSQPTDEQIQELQKLNAGIYYISDFKGKESCINIKDIVNIQSQFGFYIGDLERRLRKVEGSKERLKVDEVSLATVNYVLEKDFIQFEQDSLVNEYGTFPVYRCDNEKVVSYIDMKDIITERLDHRSRFNLVALTQKLNITVRKIENSTKDTVLEVINFDEADRLIKAFTKLNESISTT